MEVEASPAGRLIGELAEWSQDDFLDDGFLEEVLERLDPQGRQRIDFEHARAAIGASRHYPVPRPPNAALSDWRGPLESVLEAAPREGELVYVPVPAKTSFHHEKPWHDAGRLECLPGWRVRWSRHRSAARLEGEPVILPVPLRWRPGLTQRGLGELRSASPRNPQDIALAYEPRLAGLKEGAFGNPYGGMPRLGEALDHIDTLEQTDAHEGNASHGDRGRTRGLQRRGASWIEQAWSEEPLVKMASVQRGVSPFLSAAPRLPAGTWRRVDRWIAQLRKALTVGLDQAISIADDEVLVPLGLVAGAVTIREHRSRLDAGLAWVGLGVDGEKHELVAGVGIGIGASMAGYDGGLYATLPRFLHFGVGGLRADVEIVPAPLLAGGALAGSGWALLAQGGHPA